jgi:hypothetical protein
MNVEEAHFVATLCKEAGCILALLLGTHLTSEKQDRRCILEAERSESHCKIQYKISESCRNRKN